MMGYIKDSIASSQENITKAIGAHENNLVDESQFVTVDLELDKTQTEFAANTDQLDISLKEKTKELSELEEPKNSLLSKSSVLKSAVKYAVLGGVLGAFMVVFFLCVAFLMSDKLVSEKELKRRYGIMVLGVFSKNDKKRAFAFVDRWLDKLEGTSARETLERDGCAPAVDLPERLEAVQFYKARNAGFILIVTCAGLFCTDAFVKTDNRNQYSSCSGA